MTPNDGAPGPDGGFLGRLLTDPSGVMHDVAGAAASVALRLWPFAAAGAATGVVVITALAVARGRHRRRSARSGAVVEVLAPPEPEAAGATAFWAHLHEAFGHGRTPPWRTRPHLTWEYAWGQGGLSIRLWVPSSLSPDLVSRAAEAAWPGARARVLEDSPHALPPKWAVLGGELRLSASAWFPVASELQPDPLRALLGAAGCGPGQSAVVQVALRPLGRRASRRGRQAARNLRAGRPEGRVSRGVGLFVTARPPRVDRDPAVNPDVQLMLAKVSQPLWTASIRYAVASEHIGRGSTRQLRHRAHAVASAFGSFTGRNHFLRGKLRGGRAAIAERRMGRALLLCTPEVAAVAHLPVDKVVPELARAGARPVAPSPVVSREARDGWVLGTADIGDRRPIVLRHEDARCHLHVMGATNSGKSTLIVNLVLQDVAARRGAVVIDPAGDLVHDIYARLDDEARARTVLLDQQSRGPVPTLNMLEVPDGLTPDLVVDHLIGIFSRIFESSWGPRLEDVFRSACLTLLRRPGATLSDVPRVLTIPGEYQRYLSSDASDPLRGFWAWYEAQSVGQRAQITGPLLYKLRGFLLRPFARAIVDAPRSSIDMGHLLDGGGLLLARLPKGLLGEDTSKLLGSFIVSKTWQAATARASVPIEQRADSRLYVDECQNFLSLPRSFDEVLAEARKFRLSLVLAHQNLGQLPRSLGEAISANARNKLYFQTSVEDARLLARHLAPNVSEHDLCNLGAFQAAARVLAFDRLQPACTLTTLPMEVAA